MPSLCLASTPLPRHPPPCASQPAAPSACLQTPLGQATAFAFSGYANALAPWREELNDGYQVCLKMLNDQVGRYPT